jgi:uncharacterized protein (TIGR02421 family)
VATTLNGLAQPYCTFLGKGTPSATVTQEGLAILTETIAFVTHPERLRRIANRIRAVGLAEQGAGFMDNFHFYLNQNYSPEEAYAHAARVFRGSTPDGGPFTKDVSYSKGFILIYNYMLLAVRKGVLNRLPLLFCGKTALEDLRVLSQLVEDGLVRPPSYLPPPFADLRALVTWLCFSGFLRRLRLESIEAQYAAII